MTRYVPPTNAEYITQALATEGGPLSIGRGGGTLHYARGATLSGFDEDATKAACIAAGLPVIDSRCVPFEAVVRLAVSGPMVAAGEPPSTPPWHAFSSVPLRVVAEAYRAAGAEVWNGPPHRAAWRRGPTLTPPSPAPGPRKPERACTGRR